MQINLPWGDLWTFYKQAPLDIKVDILHQLDMDMFMTTSSTKVRKEVLEDAPQDVRERYITAIPLVTYEQATRRIHNILQNRR